MMNLLARILSHGFAFAVVALIILVLMYRGEFDVWKLPESLAIKGLPGTAEQAGSGTVDRAADDAKQPADAAAAVSPEAPVEPLAPESATDKHEVAPSDDEVPVAHAEPATEPAAEPFTTPETAAEPAAEPVTTPETVAEPVADTSEAVAEPDEGSDTGAATGSQPVEADDEPSSITAPVDTEDSTVQSTDEVSAQTTEESPIDTGDVAADEPAIATEAAPASTDTDSGSDNADPVTDNLSAAPDDATADTATTVETTTGAVTEEAAPAETAPTAVEQADTTSVASEEPATTTDSLSAAEPLAAPVNEAAPQAVVNTVPESPYEVMAKAREAYWLRDFELAEQQYHKLTQLEPDNPDGYGEMGNMYFSQGKWEEAAAAYYQAGARLLNDGLVQQARQMVDVIRGLNGEQADDLEAQINAAAAPSP